ncbi:uncharacterized protein LOC143911328 [Arctopsyche grandis]|uniref:uncharacterized protein LOC143911328 n=1 Tax=Arctopsyche grandis TaxID=121162 RepID=UPI00406DA324
MIWLICFVVIFPVAQSNIHLKNQKIAPFAENCNTATISKNEYHISCISVNVANLTAMIEAEVYNFPNGKQTIDTLLIENLVVENRKLSQNWLNTTAFRILRLDLISAEIDSIQNNAFKGFAFAELTHLRLEDMKIDTLQEGTFGSLKLVEDFEIYKCAIKHINENVLKEFAPNLVNLTVMEMQYTLNVTNITGTVPLPNLTNVQIAFNGLEDLDAGSFSHMKNVKNLYLNSNKIFEISCETFDKMTSLEKLYLNDNLLSTLDSCVFGNEVISRLGENALRIGGNKWDCNCDLDWLIQLKIQKKIQDNPTCALSFDDAIFCEEKI